MFQNIKYIIWLYIKYTWKTKTIFALLIWIFLAIGVYAEPILISKAVEIIETFYNTGELNINHIYLLFGVWLLATLVISTVHYYYKYYFSSVESLRISIWEMERSINNIFKMPYGHFLSEKPGSTFKKLDKWQIAIEQIIYNVFQDYIRWISWIIFIIALMLFVDWRMAIATIALLPVMIFLGFHINKKTAWQQKLLSKRRESLFWNLQNYVTNLQIVRFFNLENKLDNKLQNEFEDVNSKQLHISKWRTFSNIYTNTIIMLSRVLVLSTWVYLMYIKELTFAELILFVTLIWYLYFPISFLFQWLPNLERYLTEIWDYREKFEDIDVEENSKDAKPLKDIKWEISFKNVDFSYNKDRQIFENLTLNINHGEKVALVGHTGSWKSTITNLLLRLWDVNSGEIKIDWKNIKDVTYKSLREHIWIVSQDNALFNGTIKENLELIKDGTTEEQINKALKDAKADFVFKLKNWINSQIWERWLKLSGWEKQRIAIARVFLKNPEIFILDEATSALDNKTEIQIQEALDKLMIGKTSIIIAHRLSTIKHVDRIVMLEDWKIIEEWSYEELMKLWGKFAAMADPDKLILV